MNEKTMIEAIVLILVLLGTIVTLLSSVGVIRLPDVYTRAHATTKSTTLGILCILLGAFIYFAYVHEVVSIRLLLGIVFVFLTAPVAGHMIIRSAHRSNVPLAEISVQDDLQADLDQWAAEEANNPEQLDSAQAEGVGAAADVGEADRASVEAGSEGAEANAEADERIAEASVEGDHAKAHAADPNKVKKATQREES